MPLPKYTRLKKGMYIKADIKLFYKGSRTIPPKTILKIVKNMSNYIMLEVIKESDSYMRDTDCERKLVNKFFSLATEDEALVEVI